ncbi:hypothetical protein KN1_20250 [Stygiolobus caldivivus]|uniref:Uncharacterized protein n=1 Tax=Stygiolobus caldivivus TaxID=2824673 RepID=A0A8D5U7G9_9CREN|nr:hypothetical protein KN1_20250 [Stygiolobus caldivivus]
MQRFLVINKDQVDLLFDPANVKIFELLINGDLNPTQASKKLTTH